MISNLHSSTLIDCDGEPNKSECLVLGVHRVHRVCRLHRGMWATRGTKGAQGHMRCIGFISNLHSNTLIDCGGEPSKSECLVLGACRGA